MLRLKITPDALWAHLLSKEGSRWFQAMPYCTAVGLCLNVIDPCPLPEAALPPTSVPGSPPYEGG